MEGIVGLGLYFLVCIGVLVIYILGNVVGFLWYYFLNREGYFVVDLLMLLSLVGYIGVI